MNLKATILLFTGDGKGKTTALGIVLRAVGHQVRAELIQETYSLYLSRMALS